MDWSLFDWVEKIDLTHPLTPGMPTLPGDPALSVEPLEVPEGAYRMNLLSLHDHAGTHMDAPSHFIDGGRSIDKIGPSELLVRAVMVDMRDKCLEDPDYRISRRDLEAWEDDHGWFPAGGAVVIQTGWAFRWEDPARYLSVDDTGTVHTPGLGGEAADLLAERRVSIVAIDTPSVDVGRSTSYPAHKALLGSGVLVIENLSDLYRLPEAEFVLLAAPSKIAGATGAPCRVFALVDRRR